MAGMLAGGLSSALKAERVHRWLGYLVLLSFMAYIAILFAEL
jgi:hypothetical protein